MRVWSVLAVSASATATSTPLVSYGSVAALTSETFGLVKDATVYVHDSVVNAVLAEETRRQYEAYVAASMNEVWRVGGEVYVLLRPTLDIVQDASLNIYQVADKRISSLINTVIVDFERRFPNESGKIGRSLIDRILLLVYLFGFIKAIQCIAKFALRQLGWRSSPSRPSTASTGQVPVIKQFDRPTLQPRISEVASAPPRPSTASSKKQ